MHPSGLSRRGFLQNSLGSLAAAGLPLWYAKEVVALDEEGAPRKTKSANDRLQVGLIGTGDRCKGVISPLLGRSDVEIVACCDVDRSHVEEVANMVAGARPARKNRSGQIVSEAKPASKSLPKMFKDYRELLAMQGIDAVIVVTPDHWHAIPAIAAAKAKKDIYCEKPLSLTVTEGRAMVKAARENNVVFQTGSQQRTEFGGMFRLACELVRNGRLGKLRLIQTRIDGAPVAGPFKESSPPPELDWNFWLGQTAEVPYVKEKCHYTFRWFYDYSGGKMTDWGAHHNDIAQWALAMDEAGPHSVMAMGTVGSPPGGFTCHSQFLVRYEYGRCHEFAENVPVYCMSDSENGVWFEGDKGRWLFVSRDKIIASDKKIIDEPLPSNAIRLGTANNHMNNWLECIKSRQKPAADVEIAHRSATVCHLGNIALRFFPGKHLSWKPSEEKFGEAEANEHLARTMRGPWKLEG